MLQPDRSSEVNHGICVPTAPHQYQICAHNSRSTHKKEPCNWNTGDGCTVYVCVVYYTIYSQPWVLAHLWDILNRVTSLILMRLVRLNSLRTLPGAFSIACLMPASDILPNKVKLYEHNIKATKLTQWRCKQIQNSLPSPPKTNSVGHIPT